MYKPKLLHISLGTHNQGLWRAFEREFETTHYNWKTYESQPPKINSDVLKLHKEIKPDYVFMQLQRPGIIFSETARQMTKTSKTINWTGDVRTPLPQWYIDLGREITVSLFSNMTDVRLMREKNVNSDYLQVGFDEKLFCPFYAPKNIPSVIFLGSNYSYCNFPLSLLRSNMVESLKKRFKTQFCVYGNKWNNLSSGDNYLQPHEEAIAYLSSKIAINLSHFDYGRYSSDRMLRLMGSGGFCLTHEFEGIENDFIINKHIATWSTIDELIEKVGFYLANDYKREKIRKEGCTFVRQTCTWNHRIKQLKDLI